MRFGLFIPQGWRFDLVGIDPHRQWQTMSDLAQHADQGDAWESIWVYDHFHTTPEPSNEATHEAWTLMSAFAASTSRVRLGQMCTCMSYRDPAYLAKVAATADVISGGRVEMGIGGGWYEHEWRAYGYGFPSAADRLGRLREGVEIFRQMWTTGSATLAGTHYQVDGALCHPQPLQTTSAANRIPMWIAGGGEKVTLKIAAQYADYTNFDGTPEGFRHKSAVLKGHCDKVGRDFEQITRSANFNPVIGANAAQVDDKLAWYADHLGKVLGEQRGQEMADNLRNQPLVGTPDQIVGTLRELEALGMTYAITYFADAAYDRSSIELFEREVIPAFAS
ncbi:LLM class F420-dependent oxidoreductase [Yimella sp. cx-573]|nr:LLM class F420-dependent oxidoreductase [Yimella sp. cx-573]